MKAPLSLALAFLILLPSAAAASFIDSASANFSAGTFANTILDGTNLALVNESAAAYVAAGNFTSVVFDAGAVVTWTALSWTAVLPATTDVNLSFRTGNTSVPDGSWTAWTLFDNPGVANGWGRYVQYRAQLTSADSTVTPFLQTVTISYDPAPMSVSLVSPAAGTVTTNTTVVFSCAAAGPNTLTNLTLFGTFSGVWAANQTLAVSGTAATAVFSLDLLSGAYTWSCLGADSAGQEAVAPANYTVTVTGGNQPPTITSASVTPALVAVGGQADLAISASDSAGIGSVWATITLPNGSQETIALANGGSVPYTVPLAGGYGVVFSANDTLGATATTSLGFSASTPVDFSVTVKNINQTALNATVTLLKNGTVFYTATDSSGSFSTTQLDSSYDLQASSFAGEFTVLLRNVALALEGGKSLGLDIAPATAGFSIFYAVSNPYLVSGATVTIRYSDTLFINETFIDVFVCSSWDFDQRQCDTDIFSEVSGVVQNMTANTLTFNVTGFSAFGLKQQGFCGDNLCAADESTTACPVDCQCAAGQSQSCGTSDVGACAFGAQTCINGQWGPCVGEIAPIPETCNQQDDDCDGTVDDVSGGASVAGSQCQCFGGAAPISETCNNVDDDCNGLVDGFTQPCGSNIGVCQEGVRTCTLGIFGDCTGDLGSSPEVCGNGIDDDCNSFTDETCTDGGTTQTSCLNGLQDAGEQGVDCGGSCPSVCDGGSFSSTPPDLTGVSIAIVIIVLAAVGFFLYRRRSSSWSTIERRYSFKGE